MAEQSEKLLTMSHLRCIGIYLVTMFIVAFFMPLVSPTDVAFGDMEPLPKWESALQQVAYFGIPLVVVLV